MTLYTHLQGIIISGVFRAQLKRAILSIKGLGSCDHLFVLLYACLIRISGRKGWWIHHQMISDLLVSPRPCTEDMSSLSQTCTKSLINIHSTVQILLTQKEPNCYKHQNKLTILKRNLRRTCACSEEELGCASSPGRWHTGRPQHSPVHISKKQAISLAC